MSDETSTNASVSSDKQKTDYFEKIPLWSDDIKQKRFEIMSDEMSGRIPVTRLERWQDFTALVESSFFNRIGTHLVYRGHRRFDWGLEPTLARLDPRGIVSEKVADKQLSKFRKAIRGRISDRALLEQDDDEQQCDELWSIGQHHGLMTPLLDWTYSPFVGLFFSFSKEDGDHEKDNPYRAVYVLNKSFVEDDDQCPDIRVIEPRKDDHGRLVNQAGLFTFSPFDATIENKLSDVLSDSEFDDDELRNAGEDEQAEILARYICKIYIRNDDREGCLKHLRRMNVHHASLFPDLIGAADYCNTLTSEEETEELIEVLSQAHAKFNRVIETMAKTTIKIDDSSDVEVGHALDNSFEALLMEPEAASQVEQGRIKIICAELEQALAVEKVVDWKDRESAQARMRIKAKTVLRKYGYPTALRDGMAESLVERMAELEVSNGKS